MPNDRPVFRTMGDRALLVELGDGISPAVNRKVRTLFFLLEGHPIEGLVEMVPGYRSLLILFDPLRLTLSSIEAAVEAALRNPEPPPLPAPKAVDVPVVYGGPRGPDLEWVAAFHRISPEEVIRLHAEPTYQVYMIGFMPGFPYMGEGPETLEILAPGPLTTVQDLGRYGSGRHGVPPSGALDAFSLRAANLIAGNMEHEAALEITLMGLRAKVLRDVLIAVAGGNLQPRLNGKPLAMWRSHLVKRGDILSFAGPGSGCRAYLAVGGGISVPLVLGSRSTNLSSGFGGLEGRPLKAGDILLAGPPRVSTPGGLRALDSNLIPVHPPAQTLRVLPGPQEEDFPEKKKRRFFSSSFEASSQSNRTGIRLVGPPVRAKAGMPESIISEGVTPGAVQIPGDGQPIIILVETVTVGYRKIATVISADLPLAAQISPGDRISFREVSLEEALRALVAMEAVIGCLRGNL